MAEDTRWIKPDRFRKTFITTEFALVLAMLVSLIILILIVLIVPADWIVFNGSNSTVSNTDMLEFRRTILTVIITAFGAWVGAGAAYFFGRENLKVASQSLLEMKEPSAKEILSKLKIRDIPPKELTWIVKFDETVGSVMEKLKENAKLWFITVEKKDGQYTIINEEAIWRFLDNKQTNPEIQLTYEKIQEEESMGDVLDYIDKNGDLKFLKDLHVSTSLDKSASETLNDMITQDKSLAIVIDLKSDKPTHYTTSSDIKDRMMQDLSVI